MASTVVIASSSAFLLGVLLYAVRTTESTPMSSASPTSTLAPSCPPIVSRAEWGARGPTTPVPPLPHSPVSLVFIHHGASPPDGCHSNATCAAIVRAYQDFHLDTRGWTDIAYSFLVGEDGRAYEGRGWTKVGRHTLGYNEVGLGFCLIGDFTHRIPNDSALNTLRALIQCGVDSGYITSDYVMIGHRDTNNQTECPGNTFYPFLRTWPHYNSTSLQLHFVEKGYNSMSSGCASSYSDVIFLNSLSYFFDSPRKAAESLSALLLGLLVVSGRFCF